MPPLGRHRSSRCLRFGLLSASSVSGHRRRRSVAWRRRRLHWPTTAVAVEGSSDDDASGSDQRCRHHWPSPLAAADVMPADSQPIWWPSPSTKTLLLLSYSLSLLLLLLLMLLVLLSVLDFFVFIGGDETRVAVPRNMILSSSTRSGTYAHTLLLMVALLLLLLH